MIFFLTGRQRKESANYQLPDKNTWRKAAGATLRVRAVILIRLINGRNTKMEGSVHQPNLKAEVVGSPRILETLPAERLEPVVGNLLKHQVRTQNFQSIAVMLQLLVRLAGFETLQLLNDASNGSAFYGWFSTCKSCCSSINASKLSGRHMRLSLLYGNNTLVSHIQLLIAFSSCYEWGNEVIPFSMQINLSYGEWSRWAIYCIKS